jgi:hypothetical protein
MKIYNISPAAVRAKYAANLRFMYGSRAAMDYMHQYNVNPKLYRLACQLATMERHDMRMERSAHLAGD